MLCPVCAAKEISNNLILYQINFTEAVYLCENRKCSYPENHDWIFVNRKLEDIRQTEGELLTHSEGRSEPTCGDDFDQWLNDIFDTSQKLTANQTNIVHETFDIDEFENLLIGEEKDCNNVDSALQSMNFLDNICTDNTETHSSCFEEVPKLQQVGQVNPMLDKETCSVSANSCRKGAVINILSDIIICSQETFSNQSSALHNSINANVFNQMNEKVNTKKDETILPFNNINEEKRQFHAEKNYGQSTLLNNVPSDDQILTELQCSTNFDNPLHADDSVSQRDQTYDIDKSCNDASEVRANHLVESSNIRRSSRIRNKCKEPAVEPITKAVKNEPAKHSDSTIIKGKPFKMSAEMREKIREYDCQRQINMKRRILLEASGIELGNTLKAVPFLKSLPHSK